VLGSYCWWGRAFWQKFWLQKWNHGLGHIWNKKCHFSQCFFLDRCICNDQLWRRLWEISMSSCALLWQGKAARMNAQSGGLEILREPFRADDDLDIFPELSIAFFRCEHRVHINHIDVSLVVSLWELWVVTVYVVFLPLEANIIHGQFLWVWLR